MARAAYHHGDLPRAVLEEALRDLEAGDRFAINVSRIARTLGVSHGAVYRHFPTKQAILDALAIDGFEQLARVFAGALEATDDAPPTERIRLLARAYVRFVLEHPMLTRIMFTGVAADRHRDPALKNASLATILTLHREVRSLADDDLVDAADVGDITGFFWASMHGLAMLRSESKLDAGVVDDAAFDTLVDRAAGWLVRGVATSTPAATA